MDGEIKELERRESEYKVNSFKVYTCAEHNTYYSVNLQTERECYNVHHAKGQNETEYGSKLVELMRQTLLKP